MLVGWFAWTLVGVVNEEINTRDEDLQRYEDEWENEVQEEADRIERERLGNGRHRILYLLIEGNDLL